MKFWKSKKNDEAWKSYIVGSDSSKDLELLHYECAEKFEKYNKDLITKAFNWCLMGHKNQIRLSGQPYYTHPLEVARIIVNELPMDDVSVAAALMHDMCDNSDFTIDDIRSEFGDEIANIVDGIGQIQLIESYGVKQVDSYRKLIIAWFNDVRIILIKLADRLHNMRTIEFLSLERQLKLSTETMEIYSPFAHRFGLGNFKWELEDLAFKVLNREEYDKIASAIQLTREERKDYISAFIEPIRERLNSNEILSRRKIGFDIFGRAKHIYSIFNKTILREKPMEELFDLFAVRIVLDTDDISTCYIVLGILSEIYRPVPGTFKDYIADTKKNGYQSIHIAVIGMDHKPVEVQIRTRKMHDYAESGFAAHFKYKPGKVSSESVLENENFDEWVDMVRNVFENHSIGSQRDIFQSVKSNFLLEDITVFTHTKECKNLPINSTPLDFAYSVHTDIGNSCIGAKVNGRIVPLNYRLKNGDQIEILNSNNQKPTKEWLDYVVSQRAKNGIMQYLKLEQKKYLTTGIDLWVNLQNDFEIKLTDSDFRDLVKKLKYDNEDEFFVALGKQDVDIDYIHNHFYHKLKDLKRTPIDNDPERNENTSESASNKININVPIVYSECCYPIPGDRIVGEIVEGSAMYVHRRSCKNIVEKLNPLAPNVMALNWDWLHKDDYLVRFKIEAAADDEILSEITNLIMSSDSSIQIKGINFNNDDNKFEGFVTVAIQSAAQLNKLFDEIRKIPSVKRIERVSN